MPAISSMPVTGHNAPLVHLLGSIEYRAPGSLKLYANNPRKHSQKQLVKLMASIREFGFVLPVLIDETGVIVAGEARVTAARSLDLSQVPVVIAAGWSDAKVRAYRLADNRLAELATWDQQGLAAELSAIIELDETPIELLGWETAEIDLLLDTTEHEAKPDPADDQIAVPAEPVSATGDLWLLGHHRLLCGSSLDAACWTQLLDGQIAAMAFTDPPYNVPVSGHVCGLGKVKHAEFAMGVGRDEPARVHRFPDRCDRQIFGPPQGRRDPRPVHGFSPHGRTASRDRDQ